jgi:hypothetical protein
MTRCVIALSLGLLALAACSGGGATTAQQPAPPGACAAVVIVDSQAHLVSPPSGATGVSPSIGSVTVTYGDIRVFDLISLSPIDGSPGAAAANLDSTPSPGVAVVTIGALKPATKYRLTGTSANYAHIPGCFIPVTADFGSFTTQ